jgi:hypothetical protein
MKIIKDVKLIINIIFTSFIHTPLGIKIIRKLKKLLGDKI